MLEIYIFGENWVKTLKKCHCWFKNVKFVSKLVVFNNTSHLTRKCLKIFTLGPIANEITETTCIL